MPSSGIEHRQEINGNHRKKLQRCGRKSVVAGSRLPAMADATQEPRNQERKHRKNVNQPERM